VVRAAEGLNAQQVLLDTHQVKRRNAVLVVIVALGIDGKVRRQHIVVSVVLTILQRHIGRAYLTRGAQRHTYLGYALHILGQYSTGQDAARAFAADIVVVKDHNRGRAEVFVPLAPADLSVAVVIRTAVSDPDLYAQFHAEGRN